MAQVQENGLAIELIELYIQAVERGTDATEDNLINRIRDMIVEGDIDGDAALFIEGSFMDDGDNVAMVIEQAEAALEVLRGTLPSGRIQGAAA